MVAHNTGSVGVRSSNLLCSTSKKPLSYKGLRVFLVLRPLRAACLSGGAAPQKPARDVWIPRVHSLKPGTPGRVPGLFDHPLNHRGSCALAHSPYLCLRLQPTLIPSEPVAHRVDASPSPQTPFPLRSFIAKSSTDFLIIFSNLRKCWKGLLYQAFPAFCVSEDTPHIMAFRSLTWR